MSAMLISPPLIWRSSLIVLSNRFPSSAIKLMLSNVTLSCFVSPASPVTLYWKNPSTRLSFFTNILNGIATLADSGRWSSGVTSACITLMPPSESEESHSRGFSKITVSAIRFPPKSPIQDIFTKKRSTEISVAPSDPLSRMLFSSISPQKKEARLLSHVIVPTRL